MHIQKETPINEILAVYPEAVRFFRQLEMGCAHCYAVNFETLEKGALMHGLDAERLVRQLQSFIANLPEASQSVRP